MDNSTVSELFSLIRQLYPGNEVLLHSPSYLSCSGNEILDILDSSFVSSMGSKVLDFEKLLADYTGAQYCVAVVNGTSAIHLGLLACGVGPGCEVITQALTFVGTVNPILSCGAEPVFVDVDANTLSISPLALRSWITQNTHFCDGRLQNKNTGKRIAACLPVYNLGLPMHIREILEICCEYNLPLIEDSAEAIGTTINGKHAGRFGNCGILSFNGNKTITTGGGGAILTDDPKIAETVRHLSTTAKSYKNGRQIHNAHGYNYRMPALNAVLGISQMRLLTPILDSKKQVFERYRSFFNGKGMSLFEADEFGVSNHWLNAIECENEKMASGLVQQALEAKIEFRRLWSLVSDFPMYRHCQKDELCCSKIKSERVVALPSSALSNFEGSHD